MAWVAADEQVGVAGQGKKKKKAGKATVTHLADDEIDALLSELDGPQSLARDEPAPAQDAQPADIVADMMPGECCAMRTQGKVCSLAGAQHTANACRDLCMAHRQLHMR